MNDKLPKTLVISVNVWQDSGNIRTLPEIFACYDKEKVAQIYTKAGVPETQVGTAEKVQSCPKKAQLVYDSLQRACVAFRQVENS